MNEIACYIKKMHNKFEKGRSHALRKFDITSTQMDVLEYLYTCQDSETTLSDLTAFFEVQHTSMIHVLHILESKDLIRRKEETGIRRKPILLTAKGLSIMQDVANHRAVMDEVMYRGISEKDLAALESLLGRVYTNMKEYDES